jgi:ornithine cyclodeaminase/alanine dehydrogenase-like protein (mu-crystallin family)
MPASLDGVMGVKVMTLTRGLGTRYLVLVYEQESGALVGALDAAEITRLRTAATTAVAGEQLAPEGCAVLGLVGSGFEAEGHLRVFANQWPLEHVDVFSRSAERRETFAARLGADLGLDVRPVATVAEAVSTAPVSVLATKSTEPVVDGSAFPAGAVVLSIGSTRPDLRELDRATLRRAAVLVVDDAAEVTRESGDIIDGLDSGALSREHVVSMAALAPGARPSADGRDLLVFKSVGTAVHDLSLAIALLDAARAAGRGRDLGELTGLKPFAGDARPVAGLRE